MLTEAEQEHMLETLGITDEAAQGKARIAYDVAWKALNDALDHYAVAMLKEETPGILAFAVWDYMMREAVNHHRGIIASATQED